MDTLGLNKNYIRFGVLIFVVILINLAIYYRSTILPSVPYQQFFSSDGDTKQPELPHTTAAWSRLVFNQQKTTNSLATKPTVFCIIKTHPDNIKANKTRTVLDVWARKCDNYRFISLIPKQLLPESYNGSSSVEVEVSEPFYILQPQFHVKETHEKLTDKLYRAFESVYRRFPDYDWYYISDDDAYVNINNLKAFLRDKNSSDLVTFGFDFKVIVKDGYHSGGPGFVVSGEAFRSLGKKLNEDYKGCKNTGTDDVDINDCLRLLGAHIGKSVDEFGRQRWLCLSLMDFWTGNFPDWLKDYSTYPLKKGVECCSDSLIGVHYMSPQDIIRLDIAIEVQQNILDLYAKYTSKGRKVTFGDIFKNYQRLEVFEQGA